jgi:hypothetical protein
MVKVLPQPYITSSRRTLQGADTYLYELAPFWYSKKIDEPQVYIDYMVRITIYRYRWRKAKTPTRLL